MAGSAQPASSNSPVNPPVCRDSGRGPSIMTPPCGYCRAVIEGFDMPRLLLIGLLALALAAPARAAEPPFYKDKSELRVYLDGKGKAVPVKTAADWQKRRDHILANMQLVMGTLPPD